MRHLQKALPELLIFVSVGFFAVRELGTFPRLFADDALFTIVARTLASGRGYALPVLHSLWSFPYVLGVGPPLILPAAAAIKVFGFSVAVTRVPQVAYLFAACIAFYTLARRIDGTVSARWSLLLLVTLSAFVNTGKVLLGEVPGIFFLILGLLSLPRATYSFGWSVLAGICFGLAVLTKLTCGLIFPALGIAWTCCMIRKEWRMAGMLALSGTIILAVFLPWRMIESASHGGLLSEFMFLWTGGTSDDSLRSIVLHPKNLLRLPFLSFGVFLAVGGLGFMHARKNLDRSSGVVIASLILLFTAYFLSSFGWYRHLLPAHVLLLPFVPWGVRVLLRRRYASIALVMIAVLQGLWQWNHMGAARGSQASEAATYVTKNMSGSALIIQQAEVFAILPENSQWRFLPNPALAKRLPESLRTLDIEERCAPVLRKLGEEERKMHFGNLIPVTEEFFILMPEKNCK